MTGRGDVVVFVGPSVPVDDARAVLDATYLPPVGEGDVYRAGRTRPRCIGIIDGYFDRVPAVWHKEILWAMQEGIHVFGSASMGALRAAELHTFGMEGVGAVFELYRSGEVEDDDEVAVVHAPASDGYRPLSEAMVNIRSTVAAAQRDGVLDDESGARWLHVAKDLHYAQRAWPRILDAGEKDGIAAAGIEALRGWLPTGRVDQKRRDGLAMLQAMAAALVDDPAPKRVSYRMAPTVMWETARLRAGAVHRDGAMLALDSVLDEVRLDPGAFATMREALLLRFLAKREADRTGAAVDQLAVVEQARNRRAQLGLAEDDDWSAWCAEVGLHPADLQRLLREDVLVDRTLRYAQDEAYAALIDLLRLDGRGEVVDRAMAKQRFIDERGLRHAAPEDVGRTEPELVAWYFQERCGIPIPDDLAAFARAAGFADEDAFHAAILREHAFHTGS